MIQAPDELSGAMVFAWHTELQRWYTRRDKSRPFTKMHQVVRTPSEDSDPVVMAEFATELEAEHYRDLHSHKWAYKAMMRAI